MGVNQRDNLAFRWLLLLSIITSILLLSDDFILRWLGAPDRAELEFKYVITLWAVNLCFWLSGRRWLVNLILTLFSVMQLIQLTKIDYSGTPLHPYDIANLFRNYADVQAVFWHELPKRLDVLLAWIIPYGLSFYLFNRFMPRYRKLSHKAWSMIAVVLMVYAVISRPISALDHRMIDFMPGATRSSLHNSLNAFGYYIAKMAFRTPQVDRPDFKPYHITPAPVPDEAETIVMVIPDSLRFDRMSIGGYQRHTTPYLAELKKQGKIQVAEGIASSVATGASLPLLVNAIREPGNLAELKAKTANLYRHAKQAGYRTFWVSTEESKLVSNLGAQYIDHIITEEDYLLDIKEKGDLAVMQQLNQMHLGKKNFIIIMLRSVHAPYNYAYSHAPDPSQYKLWPTDGVSDSTRMSNAYDDAVYYLDQAILPRLIDWADKSTDGDVLWVLTSDHAEELGTMGKWGHNVLTPNVAEVPMVLYQRRDSAKDTPYQLPHDRFVSHYELAKWLLRRMGFVLHNPNEKVNQLFFQGFNLFGDNNYRRILKTADGLVFCKRRFISNFYAGPGCPPGAEIHHFYRDYAERVAR